MNIGQVVRMDADPQGIDLRLWIDDERGHHLATCEVRVPANTLALWWVQCREAQDRASQEPLPGL